MVACLVLFALPAAAVDFFHTEHELTRCDSCPACQVRQAASSEVSTPVEVVPVLTVVGVVELVRLPPPALAVTAETAARGPPAA